MTNTLSFNHAINAFKGFQKAGNRKVGTSKTGLAVWTISKLPGSSSYRFIDAKGRKIIRIHASGELETAAELMEYVNLAVKYPRHIFGIYSKRIDLVKNVLDVTETFPRNFCMNVSVWRDYNIKYGMELVKKGIAQVFAVDPAEVTDNAEYCPAYDEKGHMLDGHECNKCMKCYTNKARFIICPEH